MEDKRTSEPIILLDLFHRVLSQICGGEQGQISLVADQMQDHSLQEEEDFNQIRKINAFMIIEIEVLQQLLSEMLQLHQEHHLLVGHLRHIE